MMILCTIHCFLLYCLSVAVTSFSNGNMGKQQIALRSLRLNTFSVIRCNRTPLFATESNDPAKGNDDLDETTKKYGLEVGLYKSLTTTDSQTLKPKDLLAKYGVAYLATSITLALISYAICYVLVSNGIDLTPLLAKVGISATDTAATNAGTAAIAYAIHKAASPIRFPPTVALTPIVANWLGNSKKDAPTNTSPEA